MRRFFCRLTQLESAFVNYIILLQNMARFLFFLLEIHWKPFNKPGVVIPRDTSSCWSHTSQMSWSGFHGFPAAALWPQRCCALTRISAWYIFVWLRNNTAWRWQANRANLTPSVGCSRWNGAENCSCGLHMANSSVSCTWKLRSDPQRRARMNETQLQKYTFLSTGGNIAHFLLF